MLSELVTHSCRGLLSHSAKNVALFQQTVTHSCRGLSHSAKNVAQQKSLNPRRRLSVDELPSNVNNSMALAGVSAFGLAALAYYGKQLSKEETNVIVDSTTFPHYVRDRMTSAYESRLAGLAVTALGVVVLSRSAEFVKFAKSLSGRGKVAMCVCSFVVLPLAASISDSKQVGWWVKHIALGVLAAAFCVPKQGLLVMGYFLGSAGITVGLSIAAMTAPSENFLLTKSGPLAMGLGAACAYGIGNRYLPSLSPLGFRHRMALGVMLVLDVAFSISRAQSDVKNASEIPRLFNPLDYGL